MRKVFRYMTDVPQGVADRGTELIERHLAAYGVSRAMDLPEEGKVSLAHQLDNFFAGELPGGLPERRPWHALRPLWARVRGFFSDA